MMRVSSSSDFIHLIQNDSVLGWWSFFLLNGGVALTSVARWFAIDSFALSGRLLILLSVMVYVVMIWPRVKPLASR
jgi:hypothetical protein